MTVTEHTQNNNDGHFPKEENGAGLQTTKSCHGPLRAMRRAVEPRMHGIGIHARPPLRRKHVVCKQCRVPFGTVYPKSSQNSTHPYTRFHAPPNQIQAVIGDSQPNIHSPRSNSGQPKVNPRPLAYIRLSNALQTVDTSVCQMYFKFAMHSSVKCISIRAHSSQSSHRSGSAVPTIETAGNAD